MPATAGLATNFYPRQIACASGLSGSSLANASASTPTCSITSGRRSPAAKAVVVWPASRIQRSSNPDAILRHGSGLYRGRIQAGARSPWGHHQSRNGYLRQIAHGRGDRGDPPRPAQQCTPALARAVHGSPPNKGRGYRTRQQDRPNGVGPDEQRRTLSRSAGNAGDRVDGGIETKRG